MQQRPTLATAPHSRRRLASILFMPAMVVLALATGSGCSTEDDSEIGSKEDLARYADCPGLKHSHHEELISELARIESEQATPARLDRNRRRLIGADDQTQHLAEILTDAILEELQPKVDLVYPQGAFQLEARGQQQAQRLLDEYEQQRRAYTTLIETTSIYFSTELSYGLAADVSFVDRVRLGNRLIALEAGQRIEQGRLSDAVELIRVLLRGVEKLAEVPHLVPRIAAVHLRAEAFDVIAALTRHPRVSSEHYDSLLEIVTNQIRQWPADKSPWVADRAVGLHMFELVRDGYLLSLLNLDEMKEFDRGLGLNEVSQQILENLDADQLFYLTAMRDVISECDRPYYLRQAQLKQIEQNLEQQRAVFNYPFLADRMLLRDLRAAQRWQAIDLARCRAWQDALRAGLGETGNPQVNPLTGRQLIQDVSDEYVTIGAIDPLESEREIRIPLRRRPIAHKPETQTR